MKLEQGIEIARLIERAIIPQGYHCALGGSVLHAGESQKDLDIFIYPHCGRELNPTMLRLALNKAGFMCEQKWGRSQNSEDTKIIETWSYKGHRLDFFFVQ